MDPFRFFSNKIKGSNNSARFAASSSSSSAIKKKPSSKISDELAYCYLIEEIIEKYNYYIFLIEEMNAIEGEYKNKQIPRDVRARFIDLDDERNKSKEFINKNMIKIENYANIFAKKNMTAENEFYLKPVYDTNYRMWKFLEK